MAFKLFGYYPSPLPSEEKAFKKIRSEIDKIGKEESDCIDDLSKKLKEEKKWTEEKNYIKYKRKTLNNILGIGLNISLVIFFICCFSIKGYGFFVTFLSSLTCSAISALVFLIISAIATPIIVHYRTKSSKANIIYLESEIERTKKHFEKLKENCYSQITAQRKFSNINKFSSHEIIVSIINDLSEKFSTSIKNTCRSTCIDKISASVYLCVSSNFIKYHDCSENKYYLNYVKYSNFNSMIYFRSEGFEPISSIEERKQATKAIAEAVKELIIYNFPYDVSNELLYNSKNYKPTISITYSADSADFCSATITYECRNANYKSPEPLKPWF